MRSIKTRAALGMFVAVVPLLTACGGGAGIRKLNETETTYFTNLNTHLKGSVDKMQELLTTTGANEQQALQQIALLDDNIRRAKVVYSVREVLTAPKTDSAAFIQVTRNKIILYYLAEAAQAQNEKLTAASAKGEEERRQLISDLGSLNKLVSDAIASNQLLHNYLNESSTAQLADFIAEVSRQVSAFDEGIKAADQNNAAIQRMVQAGNAADKRVQQANEGLSNFIDVWFKLNQKQK